jgi:hypothetical protein
VRETKEYHMTSKTLTSAAAAAALIGAIGFAYAQTSDSSTAAPATGTAATVVPATPSDTNAAPAAPAATPAAASPQQPTGAGMTSTPAPAELPAQADRN